MSKVTIEEIVDMLRSESSDTARDWMADKIDQHGIAPPDGCAIVPTEATPQICLTIMRGLSNRLNNGDLYKSIIEVGAK